MASYNLKFNSDDSVVRHTIIGLLADLNNKIYFHRQLDADNRKVIDVPFYYSITGDDQFLRDNFLFSTPSGPDCHPDIAFADGNYDVIPRGIVSLTGLAIDSGNLVNKRNMGTYTKMNSDGAMEGYSAEFEMIPITLSLDVEILVSSTLDALKITEMIIKKLYKSNNFNVEVGHLEEATYRLNSYYAIPDDFEVSSPIDFTFEDKDKYKVSFPVEINSFIPSFEWDTERHVGNRMFEVVASTVTSNNVNGDTNAVPESTTLPGANIVIPLNGILNTGLIPVEQGYYNQEAILLATNGTVTIDTSNFTGATSISIAEGGVVNIKFYNGKWYVVGSSNATINY